MSWDVRYQNEYLQRLKVRLVDATTGPAIGRDQGLIPEIERETERKIAEYSQLAVDEEVRPHLRLTSLVLASYEALLARGMPAEQAVDLIVDAFRGVGQATVGLYSQVFLAFSGDPYSAITRAVKERSLEQYAGVWDFRLEDTPDAFAITITKCFYHDFFEAAETRQLTRVFCAWDSSWIEEIGPRRYGVSFSRPTTMGLGGEECPFIFERGKRGT